MLSLFYQIILAYKINRLEKRLTRLNNQVRLFEIPSELAAPIIIEYEHKIRSLKKKLHPPTPISIGNPPNHQAREVNRLLDLHNHRHQYSYEELYSHLHERTPY